MKNNRVELKMPWLSPEETALEVKKWLIEPGDPVVIDQDILLLVVDGAEFILPAPFDGRLIEKKAEPGDMPAPGDVLAVFAIK